MNKIVIASLVAVVIAATLAYYLYQMSAKLQSTESSCAKDAAAAAASLKEVKEAAIAQYQSKEVECLLQAQEAAAKLKAAESEAVNFEKSAKNAVTQALDLRKLLTEQESKAAQALNDAAAAKLTASVAQAELNALIAKHAAMPKLRQNQVFVSPGKAIGGPLTGNATGMVYCPYENDYLEQLEIASTGGFVTGLRATCSKSREDGTKYTTEWIGANSGEQTGMVDISGGSISGRSGAWLDSIGSIGGDGGAPWSFACPTGKIAAMDIDKNSDYIVNIKPYCADLR